MTCFIAKAVAILSKEKLSHSACARMKNSSDKILICIPLRHIDISNDSYNKYRICHEFTVEIKFY